MVDAKLLDFESTPVEDIQQSTDRLRATFRSGKTKNVEFRLVQLRKLYWALNDNRELLYAALHKDLRKPQHEAIMHEVDWVMSEIMYQIKHMHEHIKEETLPNVPLTLSALKPRVRKEPKGMVLVIGAYNFPVQLTLSPVAGAIAAGCTVLMKPSEGAPYTAMAIRHVVESCLDPSAYAVVNGAVPETQALLDVKWDHIFYTGGAAVAKIIAKKAAETLTSYTLELGGLNPAIITKHGDVKLAARRLLWSKAANAGQVCLSQNYILVERPVVNTLIEALKAAYKDFFPAGAKNSPDYGRIVNERHFLRMKKMLDSTSGKIVLGGETDQSDLYIEPTAVQVTSINDPCVTEESFGPIFSILPFDTLDEAINTANTVFATPLALYVFGNKRETERILDNVTSGSAVVNDAYAHMAVPTLPFGGVGESGTGQYRGPSSFMTFSHRRPVAQTPSWMDKLLRVRYMPYDATALARFQAMNASKPDFDRAGRPVRGLGYWISFLFSLGSRRGAKGALLRWVLLLTTAYVLTSRRQSLGY